YYSSVRPKPLLEGLEKPTQALRRRGVRYIEVRSFDVNAFEPAGVSAEQLHFMDAFIRFCFLADSPRIAARERRAIDDNLVLTAHRGREPGLRLERAGQAIPLRDWALALLDAMTAIADWFDGGPGGPCVASLQRQRAKVLDPDLTPSARMLAEMRERREGFFAFAQRLSQAHRQAYLARPPSAERLALFQHLTQDSLRRQAALEAADDQPFDTFLAHYLAGGSGL
ncbi:MAG TPA: glutamate--cysteine ligase, partial [Chromatiaceae bacterium]|nr:glutamate--cysteine ligase [Chromatiaceae bacterium]